MTAAAAVERGIVQAVTFEPYLIQDGQGLIAGDGGWGVAPRAGIGQRADGTLIFVVLDGRQPDWSLGATLSDLMNVFFEYEAVNAANLDGGSSAEMVVNGQVVNRLWNLFGERYMPTAWVIE
jgi:exopolysaccharide biosynthesis protein